MTIEEMKRIKQEMGYSNKTVAEKSGVPLGTVQKVLSGSTSSPREHTIRALELFFRNVQEKESVSYSQNYSGTMAVQEPSASRTMVMREPSPWGKAQSSQTEEKRKYTLDDYFALPDDQRVELIDGVFYDMAAPKTKHQAIAGQIYALFLSHVQTHKGSCYPFIAPTDVQLDKDQYTMVQPDVMILCDRDKLKDGRIYGAPDFVLEVLSPSTRKKDMQLKVYKYGYAGVREYWIVDQKSKMVIQYDFEHMLPPGLYTFEDKVPVLIWNGSCQVDFKAMMDSISWLEE